MGCGGSQRCKGAKGTKECRGDPWVARCLLAAAMSGFIDYNGKRVFTANGVRMFVFISHSNEDAHHANQLEKAMRPGGFRAWRFQSDMVGAKPWDPQLPANIEECAIFLLATTQNALDSVTCEREWQHAALKEKPFVPVILKRGVYPPSPIDDHQCVLFDGSDESGARLIVALQNAQPLSWETIPSHWKTWDGKTKAEFRSSTKRRREIPLPPLRRELTDMEMDDFLFDAFSEIRAYFGEALCALESAYAGINTRIFDESDTVFKCQLYKHGELKKSCVIWKSDNRGFNGIAYSEDYGHTSFFNQNSYNELARVIVLDGNPALEFTLGLLMFAQNDDCRICTVEKASECLWRYFTREMSQESPLW